MLLNKLSLTDDMQTSQCGAYTADTCLNEVHSVHLVLFILDFVFLFFIYLFFSYFFFKPSIKYWPNTSNYNLHAEHDFISVITKQEKNP